MLMQEPQQWIPLPVHHPCQPPPAFKRENAFMDRLTPFRAMPRIEERGGIVFDRPANDHFHVVHVLPSLPLMLAQSEYILQEILDQLFGSGELIGLFPLSIMPVIPPARPGIVTD